MKRAYSPKDIAAKKWVTLPWGEKWNKPFGFPAENASWFISGASASGKSSFVMQLSKELCKYGLVLYLSYEEGVNQTFQRRMEYLKMNEVQGKFRVVVDETYEELIDRLKKPKSPKFIIVDSYQVSEWEYPDAVALMKRFPKKCFIWISQEKKSQPMGGGAIRLRYICDMKIRVVGYKAYCQGRAIGEAGSYYVVWEEGIIQTRNMGFSPVNPFKNGLPDEAHWREHMRADIALLLDCEYIYMLKDWELSKGAKLELDVASSCGIKVLFE